MVGGERCSGRKQGVARHGRINILLAMLWALKLLTLLVGGSMVDNAEVSNHCSGR